MRSHPVYLFIFSYAEDTNAKFLKMELFRNGGGAEMIFILPHERDGLDQLESNVEQLIQKQSYSNAKVDVQLPKFTINTDLKMKPMLQNVRNLKCNINHKKSATLPIFY